MKRWPFQVALFLFITNCDYPSSKYGKVQLVAASCPSDIAVDYKGKSPSFAAELDNFDPVTSFKVVDRSLDR